MTIDWLAFLTVLVVSLVSACLLVTLFSLGLRLNDGPTAWHRPVSVALFVVCAVVVILGIYLIVPFLHP
ncbi:MAG: hypothetical protein ABIO06_00800 [Pseudolysinimonas sp.]